MFSSNYIIPIAIIVYAIFQYQKREQLHKERMEQLKRDIIPFFQQRLPTLSGIIYTIVVSFLLLVTIILYLILISHKISYHNLWSVGLVLLPLFFLVLLIFLILIVRRDIRIYKSIQKS